MAKMRADELLILPMPRMVRLGEGVWEMPARSVAKADVVFLGAEDAPEALGEWAMEPEGYGLVIDRRGARIYAAQPAGHFYGEMTLKQLMRQFGNELPCLEIGDAPRVGHRGAALSFPQGHTEYRRAYMRHLVPKLALWKINALYLYLETYFDFPSLPHFAGPGAMAVADARELDSLCNAYNITLIPMLNTLAHCGEILGTQRYHDLIEHAPYVHPATATNYDLCASNPKTHALVDALLGDIMDYFSSGIIHVGGDEVVHMGECELCAATGRSKLEIYLDYFGRIRDVCAARGRKIGIWGDMLLHHLTEAEESARKEAFGRLDGVVIYDWHYMGGSPESLKLFVDAGMETIACSSTKLGQSTGMWMGQSSCQRMLFGDAIAAGAQGCMTTAWLNYLGVHEEQWNYLHATGGTAAWSGPNGDDLAPGLSRERMERAYLLQRYDMKDDTLTRFWHVLGDAKGPVVQALRPMHGAQPRRCVLHTDNVLTAWRDYGAILQGEKLEQYRTGLREARELWDKLEADKAKDPYLPLMVGPLLIHEHLLSRIDATARMYTAYEEAARAQYDEPERCAALLWRAADVLLNHLGDFIPLEDYLATMRRKLGLERSSIQRLRATQAGMLKLARFLRHPAALKRPLPAFPWLHNVFLGKGLNDYYLDREHDWASGPAQFQRHGVFASVWKSGAANEEME